MVADSAPAPRHEVDRMLADAVLPMDIRPQSASAGGAPRRALLTGVCGFLGRHVALELLKHTDLRLVCLVRDRADETAAARVARVLSAVGVGREDLAHRVEVLAGDLTEPRFGLHPKCYADLERQVQVIYHCAALVDWVRSYRHLYRMNVGGVLALIRLACAGPVKRLLFVSSAAVCYSRSGPECVDEDTDMLPFVGGMPLGYARSKCVAEALLNQAGARGVPVTVLRPALIAGDSLSGVSNPADLIAALVQGCVATGIAIDTDWLLDCLPVDFVATVIARVDQGDSTWRVLNLLHERPRHWRELILWMNLHGYPVALVSDNTWIRQLFEERRARGTMLYAQRRFFRGRPTGAQQAAWLRPYEAYLAAGQARIDSRRTRALLVDSGLREAPLDAELLHAYFEDYRRTGVLPRRAVTCGPTLSLDRLLGGAWSDRCGLGGGRRWLAAARTPIGGHDGLLVEIAAARVRYGAGLWQLRHGRGQVSGASGPAVAVLKVKVADRLVEELTIDMAHVCRPALGRLFSQYSDALGLRGCHERELAVYELDEPRLVRHMPACYGTLRDPGSGRWALLMEYLPEADGTAQRSGLQARDAAFDAILGGLAEIHAIWYRRERELAGRSWLAATPEPDRMLEMVPLWLELADFAAPWFEAWCGPVVKDLQADFIADLAHWWPRLRGLPATLIHNDFNPRNVVLREADGRRRLCAYDWELATLGPPQHDLAEMLCFTWHDGMTQHELDRLLETHRAALSAASGVEIDPLQWREGFALSLRHLLINRFALYTLMHRFRPLDYLPRVMRHWLRLYTWA